MVQMLHALGQGLMHKRLLILNTPTHPNMLANATEMALACSSVTWRGLPSKNISPIASAPASAAASASASLVMPQILTVTLTNDPGQANFPAVLDAARVALLEVLLGNLAIHAFRRLEGVNRFAAFGEGLNFLALRLAV